LVVVHLELQIVELGVLDHVHDNVRGSVGILVIFISLINLNLFWQSVDFGGSERAVETR
jgi:hypothetical protein